MAKIAKLKIFDLLGQYLGLQCQKLIIFSLHIALLIWIAYVLKNSGTMEVKLALYHFFGLSLTGGLLIRGCAHWGKQLYLKEQNKPKGPGPLK